ncbi:MAG TPA: TIGR02996 domain-containing protein [Gemmataceae bacterium]|nr:TIGR02996 domain-containing protein [Gemmataceae bacterium]
MTDDEAFLRAILAAPRDEAPRLAFADWLDERGDPRGAYLRAEVNWARSQSADDMNAVRAAATGLDLVWSARVSRPPAGVCCDRVRFRKHEPDLKRPTLTPRAIDAVEGRFGITFSADYRAFLLNYNGGRPDPGTFHQPNGQWVELYHLHTIWSMDGTAPYDEHDLVQRLEMIEEERARGGEILWSDRRARDLIDIGRAAIGGLEELCLGVTGEAPGRVYLIDLWMEAPEPVVKVADSFAEFLGLFGAVGSG